MARIIITGGSGFLGKHLCRALIAEGHSLKNIDIRDNPEVPTVIADIKDPQRMIEEIKDADVVFHLAALIEAGESVKFPQKFIDTNITGTLNVLDAMRQNSIPVFVFSSTAAVYGEPLKTPIKEDDRTIPINPYGMTKLAIEGLLSSYVASYGMTGIALRYFNLYGVEENHQPETHAIPRFISQIYNDQEVTVWGDGGHLRDFIYVSDVVSAHITALELAQKEPNQYHYMNLSTNSPTSVIEVLRLIEQKMNKKANIKNYPDRPGDPRVLTADASKAQLKMGWTAKVGIDEGIEKTVQYFISLWEQKA